MLLGRATRGRPRAILPRTLQMVSLPPTHGRKAIVGWPPCMQCPLRAEPPIVGMQHMLSWMVFEPDVVAAELRSARSTLNANALRTLLPNAALSLPHRGVASKSVGSKIRSIHMGLSDGEGCPRSSGAALCLPNVMRRLRRYLERTSAGFVQTSLAASVVTKAPWLSRLSSGSVVRRWRAQWVATWHPRPVHCCSRRP